MQVMYFKKEAVYDTFFRVSGILKLYEILK